MPAIRRGVTETPAVKNTQPVEPEEALEDEDVADDEQVVDQAPETDVVEDGEVAAGLPVYDMVAEDKEAGFDFFGTVHADLKEAGYVSNQAQTKDLLQYLYRMMFHATFENNEHKIDGIGTLYVEIKPATEKTATFDMKNGVAKGETYTTESKYVFKFNMIGACKAHLAEIAQMEGYSPDELLIEGEEEAEDE